MGVLGRGVGGGVGPKIFPVRVRSHSNAKFSHSILKAGKTVHGLAMEDGSMV